MRRWAEFVGAPPAPPVLIQVPGRQIVQFLILVLYLTFAFFQTYYDGFQISITLFKLGNIGEGNQYAASRIIFTCYRRSV